MKMYLALGIMVVMGIPFCKKDFLNPREEGTILISGTDYTKIENLFLSVANVYGKLRVEATFTLGYMSMFEISSDDADKGSTAEDAPNSKEFDAMQITASNALLNDYWKACYNVISACNFAIQELENFRPYLKNADTPLIRIYKADAQIIRAYTYFNLIRAFGGVPIVDQTKTANELANIKRSSEEESWHFVEKDLDDGITNATPVVTKNYLGRVTKYTALALKAKVKMIKKDWTAVKTLTDEIINSGRFSLDPNFEHLFSVEGENGSESIFEIQSSDLGLPLSPNGKPYTEYGYIQGPRNNSPGNMQGWGFKVPSKKFRDFLITREEWNETDPTKDKPRGRTTILRTGTKKGADFITYVSGNPQYYNGKVFVPSTDNNWAYNGYGLDHNPRIIRYADVLLMNAEAALNGAGGDALININQIRERADLPELNTVTIQNLYDERRAELALEEHRYFDLVRWKKAATEISGFIVGKHEHFPIPQNQIDLSNGVLTQNSGY